MNTWTFTMNLVRLLSWFSTFTPSERVALTAAFLVVVGVAGEEIIEVPAIEKNTRLKRLIKRSAIAVLLLGLAGDVLGIVMGQAEIAALTEEAGDAATSAHNAAKDAKDAHDLAQSASDIAIPAKKTAEGAKSEADAASKSADRAQQKAESAEASAANIGGLETQLKTDVDRADLILFAASSGQMLRGALFNSLGKSRWRDNVSVEWHLGARADTVLFAEKLSAAFSSFGWHVSEPPRDDAALHGVMPGVTIYNKWVKLDKPHPNASGGFGKATDDPFGLKAAIWGDGHPGMDEREVSLLAKLSLALNATLEVDPKLANDSLVIVVNDAK
jgi:hypothetical protein